MRKITASDVTAACLVILTAISLTVTIMYLKSILIPLTLSIFLYLMITPIIEKLERKYRIPTLPATLLTFLMALLVFVIVGALISSSVSGFAAASKSYEVQLNAMIGSVESLVAKYTTEFDMSSIRKSFQPSQALNLASNLTSGVLGVIGNSLLVSLFLVFMLLSRTATDVIPKLALEVRDTISRYIWTKFFISALTGFLVALFFHIMGLDFATMFGVLAFLLNFIPSIGSIVATVLPLPIALLQFGFGVPVVLILVIPLFIQIAIGNVLEPRFMGKSLDLHPITLMVFLLFWGIVWGVAGMFLAVPITSVLKIILSKFEKTQFLAQLMAGRILDPNQ